ncbi:MAG: helix-turn-helix domain-containing protein [Anaerorhabdus sp.]|uniref:helix-turn-helix domain-containing protein n=1 Tax=Anaerorhabdus sp. TaxID=1872524 RepID=UPI003A84694A
MTDERTIYPELLYFRTKILKKSVEETIKGLDISPQTYLRSENGTRELTLREASQIAKNLNLSLYVLFPKIFTNEVAKNAT